jgi:excinuclease UvrABC ATPase subunit
LFDKGIHQLSALSAPELRTLLTPLAEDASIREIVKPIVQELEGKLDTLESLGLDHVY